MRLGILGGTFDPPHIGHLILADEASHQLGLDQLLWVLTPDPPHKQGQSIRPWQLREELVLAAIRDRVNFVLSKVEIERPGPHYTVDTLRILASQYPTAELFYLIGGDSLRDLPTWYKPEELLSSVSGLGVMKRPGAVFTLGHLETILPGLTRKVQFINAPLLEISSTDIRERITDGRPFRYFLPLHVFTIIQSKNLYKV